MNAKAHTLKNLKMGSTMKQFLLSLVATTISIVLTFGTATWLENRKKEEVKCEMVMMILYDLAGIIEQVEQTDSMFRCGFEHQVALAENPDLLEQQPWLFTQILNYALFKYSNTVEHIFSSNIETVSTLGNVLFAENVSQIYLLRNTYKELVCDKFMKESQEGAALVNYEQVMELDFLADYIVMGGLMLGEMKENFVQCQQMMGVSEADLTTYRQKREKMENTSAADSTLNALRKELIQSSKRLKEAREKGEKRTTLKKEK